MVDYGSWTRRQLREEAMARRLIPTTRSADVLTHLELELMLERADLSPPGVAKSAVALPVYDEHLREMFTRREREPLNLNDYWSAPSGDSPLGAAWEDKPHRLLYDLIGEIVRLSESMKLQGREDG